MCAKDNVYRALCVVSASVAAHGIERFQHNRSRRLHRMGERIWIR
jgi:hypothetical protein